jgi:threonine dehydrogenase-like Zn-dependent dehydrogenase
MAASLPNEGLMKALVYTGPNSLAYRDEPDPVALPGEVLVKVEAVGICGSDMHAYHGHDARRPAPLILGHEAAGTVVSGVDAGRRVAVNPLVIDPACASVHDGLPHLSPTRQILSMPPRPGAFAEFVRVPEDNLVTIPTGMSFQHAALAEPVAVSYHAVKRGAALLRRPLAKARCVVLGGGAIGLAAALVLRMMGAGEVLIGEPNAERRATAERAGAFRTYAPGDADEPRDNSVELIIDAVGAAATRTAACRMIRPGGVIVHAGLLPGHDGLDIRKITLQEVIVTGTYCYTPDDFRETVQALGDGSLGTLDWFEERPLSEGRKAFADIDANTIAAAKIVLRPD